MDCEIFGSGSAICGNFASLQSTKPEPFDYDKTAKWVEPYLFEWRETLGKTVCNCRVVEVHYAPYFGYDYYHSKYCNLLRKLDAEPGILNLYELYLPSITHYEDAVANRERIPLYIKSKSRASRVKVRHASAKLRQLALV